MRLVSIETMSVKSSILTRPGRAGALFGLYLGLIVSTFGIGYVAGQQHPNPGAAAATMVAQTNQPMASMPGMNMSTPPSRVPASAPAATTSPVGKVYPAFSFSQGERVLPDGLRLAAWSLDHGVKVFHLTAAQVSWTTVKGNTVTAWAYNGTVPGPEIRVNQGDRVRIIVKNLLPEGTTVHWHGLFVPNNMDGVPMVTQDPIKPGATFTYEFTADPVGTHQYHSHMDDLKQVTSGLYGPFIIDPKVQKYRFDREFTMIPADGPLGFIINGKSFPDTAPLVVHLGDRVRIRMINMGDMYHPFHLHGFDFREIAKDGIPVPEALQMATNEIDAAPGGSYDVAFTADRLGVWAFHCHILDHVTGPNGEMAGMITVVKVVPRATHI
jgi:FtsP/CotA-like multicopper oxidase with cupredoxin domain